MTNEENTTVRIPIIDASETPKSHVLKRDGIPMCIGTENECLEYLQKHTPYSWSHAFKYEGWQLEKWTNEWRENNA